ncbi:unnamed protein product [Musa banksii]
MMGDLPGTALETAEVVDYDGPIETGSLSPPGGNSLPRRLVGDLCLRTCTQVESGELGPTSLIIKLVNSRRGFFICCVPPFSFSSEGESFYSEGYRCLMRLPAGSMIVLLIASDIDVGVA